jgi:prepilin signal peptidase PulO-like enzyme (type II secretory pathway)
LCGTKLRFIDNIPLVSFFCLKRKCHFCHGAISWQYPIVEFSLGVLFVFVNYWHLSTGINNVGFLIRDLLVVFFLAVVFLYDFKYGEILDRFTLLPAAILFVFTLFFHWQSWQSMMIGAVVGGGFFLIQFLISRGQWIGGGDIRLGIFMGVILGFPKILIGLLLAYIFGALISVIFLALKKKTMSDSTPFGTYLTIGTLVAMVWGENLVNWYMGLLR